MKINSAEEFGALVRARRVELRLTQEELADVIGVHRRVIGQLEHGKRTVHLEIAIELARGLGLDIELRPRGS